MHFSVFVVLWCLFFAVTSAIDSKNCTESGGFCTKPEYCFNSLSQEPCDNSSKTICCQPKQNDTCLNELCGEVIHDCVFELTYNYRHPMICKLHERCGINREAFLKQCTSSQIRLTCCAQSSHVTETGEIVGPTGDIEGIQFNAYKPTPNHTTSFLIAGSAALISLVAIVAIIWIKIRDRGESREYVAERVPNLNLTAQTE
ncbi:hypothetical protein M3Y97_00041500 [Aphelenchoides bicaudatus]|nr:hypothetical protein M3Y97_00041500 [Aphelenchoides bicaudatus]